jgi:hypothetical protein
MSKQHLRPSQIITTFGPGSIVDLPHDSVMIAGIDGWLEKKPKKIIEPRLQSALNVEVFRMPPVGSYNQQDVAYVRFPRWRVCPYCERLSNRFVDDRNNPEEAPKCFSCKKATYPARLVMACSKGHIDDFPWYRWVHRGQNCTGGDLFLRGEGMTAALSDLRVECSCGKVPPRSLGGALDKNAMQALGVKCRGKQPWLDDKEAECIEHLYSLQRSASNIYFSVVRSALSIPPWSDSLFSDGDTYLTLKAWANLLAQGCPVESMRAQYAFLPISKSISFEEIMERVSLLKNIKTATLSIRQEEFLVLDSDQDSVESNFETRSKQIGSGIQKYLSRLVAVPRLREVRALVGFTRIDAPEMDPTLELFDEEQSLAVETAPISLSKQPTWLPAIENLGEGIFIKLNTERLKEWESIAAVKDRADVLIKSYSTWRQRRGLQAVKSQPPRLVLLHTLAHLLMRQLSLECGYSSASLRERIYSDDNMAGLLIYTSTPDSDGSLGGLVRQTKDPQKFVDILMSLAETARICSSDPFCRENEYQRKEPYFNGAACHACAMVSETSCEFGNRLLDRGLIISLPAASKTGFFDYAERTP